MENIRSMVSSMVRGEQTAAAIVARAMARAGQSSEVFIRLDSEVLKTADHIDAMRRAGIGLPALAGVPITLKDLFDVRGEVTLAGSKVLARNAVAAACDGDVVAALRGAGLLFIGRVNMSEFAFSGMGLNPHFGTPMSIWERETGRLPGGSSSGSAVSVAEGIVPASMGSDTAGSCRIPAAFNGVVGVKPSYARFSLRGVYPLSPSSDAPGPLGVDVDSCFLLDRLLGRQWDGMGALPDLVPRPGLRLLVPDGVVLDELDAEVATAFENGLRVLTAAGASIIRKPCAVIDASVAMFLQRAVVGYEALAHHRELLQQYADDYDPFVRQRLLSFATVSREEQAERYREKARLRAAFEREMADGGFDAVVYPTVPCIPPPIAAAQVAENTAQINLRCLRNTASVNYFDGCAVSLPAHAAGQAPVGFMVASRHGDDDNLYRMAAWIEMVLQSPDVRC